MRLLESERIWCVCGNYNDDDQIFDGEQGKIAIVMDLFWEFLW